MSVYVCVTILEIPHANLILCALCYVVAWGLYVCIRLFPHFLTKVMIFQNINWIWNTRFYFLWNCEIFLIQWRIHWCTLMNICRSFIMYPLFLSYLHEKSFLNIFSKNSQMWNFMKIRTLGAELFHADTQSLRS